MKKRTTPNAPEEGEWGFEQYFEINDLKAQLQDKDKTICKLKDTIRSLSKNTKEENVNHDKCDLEPINEELQNSMATLLSENERLCNEINHHSLSNANSDIICAACNKSMFDGVLDKCLLDLVQNGNKRSKSAKKHKKQNIWKPMGHVFTEVGFKWKPTGRIFTIVVWGSNATDIPSSSSLVMIGCPDCTLFLSQPITLIDLGKFDAKADIRIFVGYMPAKKAFRIYNRRTRIITKTIHVTFDKLTAMASEQFSSGPGLQYMTPATSSTELVSNHVSQQPCTPPIRNDWGTRLFQPMFDEYFNPPPATVSLVQEAPAPRAEVSADSPMSTSIDQDTPSTSAVDPILFTRHAGNDILLVQIYVDDTIFASTNTATCDEFANQMTSDSRCQ
ncbi:retrovirus-related pol polyprotein from transposon TNT 1-94 [Tanacetum coccineum]